MFKKPHSTATDEQGNIYITGANERPSLLVLSVDVDTMSVDIEC
jgi:hypothetical protein